MARKNPEDHTTKEERDRLAREHIAKIEGKKMPEDPAQVQRMLQKLLRTTYDEIAEIKNSPVYKSWQQTRERFSDHKEALERTADDLERQLQILEGRIAKIEQHLKEKTPPDEERIAHAKRKIREIHDEVLPVLHPDHERFSKDDA